MQQRLPQLVRRLDEHMRENRITQARIAQEAGVDQATVSRLLSKKKPPQRVTAASQKLYEYAGKVLASGKPGQTRTSAQTALQVCLNRSEAHAKTALKILTALAELCEAIDEEVASG
jgi:predicted transcriptional regulator